MGIKIKKCPKCGQNDWTPFDHNAKQTNICKECCYQTPYEEAKQRFIKILKKEKKTPFVCQLLKELEV